MAQRAKDRWPQSQWMKETTNPAPPTQTPVLGLDGEFGEETNHLLDQFLLDQGQVRRAMQ